jgi:CHAT domain-containing protein
MKIKYPLLFIVFFQSFISYSQNDSITFYYQNGEINKAIKYAKFIENYVGQKVFETDNAFLGVIAWLAVMNNEKKDSKEEKKYFQLLENKVNTDGFNKLNTPEYLVYLGKFYFEQEKFQDSEKYLKEAIEIYRKQKLRNNEYLLSLEILSKIYLKQRKFSESILNFNEATTLCIDLYGKNSYDYARNITNLGMFYLEREEFGNAEKYFIESDQLFETLYGVNNDKYIASLDNLSKFYLNFHNYTKADYYNHKGLEIVIEKYGKTHKEYLNFITNKALIKSELGDYENSLKLYDECVGLAKTIYGTSSSFYGAMISNVGSIYLKKKDLINAEKCYLIDYEITKNRFGENHFETAMCLNKLSNIYSSLKEDKKAIEYNLRSIKIIESTIGKENNNYAIVCSVLGTQYALINDLYNAEKYYSISYDIKLKINGKYNSSRVVNLENIISLYSKLKDIENSKKYLLEYFDIIKFNVLEMNFNFGQNELLNYSKRMFQDNTYYSVLNNNQIQFPEINIACFENELLLKNLSLRNQQRIKNTIEKNGDASVKEKYNLFIDNKRFLTKLEELPNAQRPSEYQQLVAETEVLEKELTRLSSTFADAKTSLAINWKQIQSKLKPNEIAIDLVHYNYYNKKWTDSIMYAAFVIKKDSKFPKYITLFEQKQLSKLLERNKKENDTIQAKILNKQYTEKAISDLFFKPLEQELKNCKTIYLAPSGLAQQINFKALPIGENQTFGEQFEIKFVSSTASILDYKPTSFQEKKDLEFILYGGIDYNKNSNEINKEENQNSFNDLATRSGIVEFNYLPGTNLEVEKINTEAKKYNFNTILKTEKNATEESIKQLDGKTTPFVLHLATHGFFFENIKQEKQDDFILMEENTKRKNYLSSEDPMMRSGLIFAGANKFWGKSNEESSTEDGILTAKEISNLDLSNCQLVVLSACETGLGQVNGSEGVYGLQRAFKMAGAKNIIMSLWKVPDAQTAELFDYFYLEFFKGKSISVSFQIALSKMKEKYPPYYWAGFVLLE